MNRNPTSLSLSVLTVKWGNATFLLKSTLHLGFPFWCVAPSSPQSRNPRVIHDLSFSLILPNGISHQSCGLIPQNISQMHSFLYLYCYHIVQAINLSLWNRVRTSWLTCCFSSSPFSFSNQSSNYKYKLDHAINLLKNLQWLAIAFRAN